MPYHNSCTIIGHLGRDVDTKFSTKGTAIHSFSIAVSKGPKDDKRTSWIDCKAFDLPDWKRDAMVKGATVLCHGELEQETWEDKNGGGKRSKIVLLAAKFNGVEVFTKSGDRQEGEGIVSQPRPRPLDQFREQRPAASMTISDDDVPF